MRVFAPPVPDCDLCPRLCGFRTDNRRKFPGFHNAPVPSFGPLGAALLIVGLAPGLKGANFTGRPFTGDYAGDLLYPTLLKFGLATGVYQERADDGLILHNCRITNAVRCVPPENKPEPGEIGNCLPFLKEEIAAMPNLKIILCLGLIAHNSTLRALGLKAVQHKFIHGKFHALPGEKFLAGSYHCSRYNTNTRRLTPAMFEAVFADIDKHLSKKAA